MVKGTERVISSDPLYKDDIASFPTVPLNPFSDQYWERYCRVSNVFNSDNFYVFLQKITLVTSVTETTFPSYKHLYLNHTFKGTVIFGYFCLCTDGHLKIRLQSLSSILFSQVDIFSLGLIFLELLVPFSTQVSC